METTEYDLYDLLIGDDDISAIGDGSVTGALTSLSNSITNLADTTSWVYYINNDQYKVRYNKYRVNVDISIIGTNATTTFTEFSSSIISDELRPRYPVSAFDNNGKLLVQIKDNDTKLYRKSMTGDNLSNVNIYAHLEWDRR